MHLSRLSDLLTTQIAEMRRNGDAFVFDALKAIHENLKNGVAQVKPLCEQLGISRMHLNRLFQKNGLGSPADFIRGKQMHIVRDLLEYTQLPLGEVAKQSGFLSAQHFTAFVKRMTGRTPTQVRNA